MFPSSSTLKSGLPAASLFIGPERTAPFPPPLLENLASFLLLPDLWAPCVILWVSNFPLDPLPNSRKHTLLWDPPIPAPLPALLQVSSANKTDLHSHFLASQPLQPHTDAASALAAAAL